jgi:prepilin-type N-terminal cleavage/methylation domain-containing protein
MLRKRFRTDRHGPRAFTLIEMLVVISLVALLVALLLPALASAREASRSSICLSNLRQMGIAMTMYREEYRQYIPVMYDLESEPYPGWGQYTVPFTYRLGPYLNSRGGFTRQQFHPQLVGRHIAYCPSAPMLREADYPNPLNNDAWLYGPFWNKHIVTYSMTTGLGYAWSAAALADPWIKPKKELTKPSDTLVYVDGRREPRIDHSFWFYRARHNGPSVNMLMGDIHAANIQEAPFLAKLTGDRVFHTYDPNLWRYAR